MAKLPRGLDTSRDLSFESNDAPCGCDRWGACERSCSKSCCTEEGIVGGLQHTLDVCSSCRQRRSARDVYESLRQVYRGKASHTEWISEREIRRGQQAYEREFGACAVDGKASCKGACGQ